MKKIAIIGGGVGGLLTAYRLLEIGLQGKIYILEEGFTPNDRNIYETENCTFGIGGAGLYVDGKICLSPFAGSTLPEQIGKEQYLRIYEDASRLIFDLIERANIPQRRIFMPSDNDVDTLRRVIESRGGTLHLHYPTLHLSPEKCHLLCKFLYDKLRSGNVEILSSTKVHDITRRDGIYELVIEGRANVRGNALQVDAVIIAVGKRGGFWLSDMLMKYGIVSTPNFTDVGLRIEVDAEKLDEFFGRFKNLRLQKNYSEGFCRTHCFIERGTAFKYKVLNRVLVGGQQWMNYRTERSSFNTLWRSSDNLSRHSGERILGLTTIDGVVQHWNDFVDGRVTPQGSVPKGWNSGRIDQLLQNSIYMHLLDFIEALTDIFPSFLKGNPLLYFPSAEWITPRIKTTEGVLTEMPNFFVVGDSSGSTQGIMATAMTVSKLIDIVKKKGLL